MRAYTEPALYSDQFEAVQMREGIVDWRPRTLDEVVADANEGGFN